MIGNVNVPGALAADIASVSSVANEALNKANQALNSSGSNGNCIVCSTTKPNALKKGLWIKTDITNKDINIVDSFEILKDNNVTLKYNIGGTAVHNTCSAWINGKMYIFGGQPYSGTPALNIIQCYDPDNDTITTLDVTLPPIDPNYPTTYPGYIYNHSCVVINNKVYIFTAAAQYQSSSGYKTYNTNKIFCFDPIQNTCVDVGCEIPILASINRSVVVNNKAYILGFYSYNGNNGSRYYNNIYCFDPSNNTIVEKNTTLDDFPYYGTAAVVHDKIYIFNGVKWNSQASIDTSNTAPGSIQCYDPTNDTLTKMNSTLRAIYANTIVKDNKIYLFGTGNVNGSNGGKSIHIYDPKIDKVIEMDINIDSVDKSTSCIDEDNNIYIYSSSASNPIRIFTTNDLNIDESLTNSIVISINNEYFVKCPISKISSDIYDYRCIDGVYYIDQDNNLHPLEFYRIENYEVAE